MDWGVSVHAKVIAINVVGSSTSSLDGNGAIIVTVPDAPINLENDVAVTTGEQIGLTWSAGVGAGGSPLIDYRISYDQASGVDVYVELRDGLTETSFTATGLIRGSTYKFKVQARNEYGFSAYSTVATILAA